MSQPSLRLVPADAGSSFGIAGRPSRLARLGPDTALAPSARRGLRAIEPHAHRICLPTLYRIGPLACLRASVLPLCPPGGMTVLACADPARLPDRCRSPDLARLPLALADRGAIQSRLADRFGPALVRRAETLRPVADSCRTLRCTPPVALLAVLALGPLALWLAPQATVAALLTLALLVLMANTALKLLMLLTRLRAGFAPRAPEPAPIAPTLPDRLPRITLLLPLLQEPEVAAKLVQAILALRYPASALEVLILVEAEDSVTRAALDGLDLPAHLRQIAVPKGSLKTKPRAMNYALPFAAGEIIGIYDAEDRPDDDQLLKVAAHFATAPPRVVCLQGRLDFYNARANLLSRCFTLDYAAWFRVILPALVAHDLPVPLGGTTVFLRRDVLEALGGWDAHNVTEDAELGFRLYRHGYRVQMLNSTTYEEANCRIRPWIKQRSRWLKGYLVTWLVAMRQPVALWRDMGPAGFATFHVLILGTLAGSVLGPLLWAFFPVFLGMAHPISRDLIPLPETMIFAALLGGQVVTLSVFLLASRLSPHRNLALWIPAMVAYYLLAAPATLRGVWETCRAPHLWHKTAHGLSAPDA